VSVIRLNAVKVRTQICLEPEQHARLLELANARGTSMAAVVRDAVDLVIDGDAARAAARRLLADEVRADAVLGHRLLA
jgi:hypothetical protein